MTTFNVMPGGRQQVLVDEQQLRQLQGEMSRRSIELERLKTAMETLNAVNAPAKFMAAAMALCNELAARWKAERVGIGFLKGRYVRLQALSHTEKITRHMQLVQDIEAAMEECLDQDLEILFPPTNDASYVYRAADRLSAKQGPSAICSFPLRREGQVAAVLTVERKSDKPLTLDEIETLRLTCDLFTPRLVDMYEHDRWAGAKAAKATRKGLAWFVGPKHTWAKVSAIAVSAALATSILVKWDHNVEASFVFSATEMQVVPAPFDGFLKTVEVNVGDPVMTEATAAPFDALNAMSPIFPMTVRRPTTVLATMNTAEIKYQKLQAEQDEQSHIQQANIYRFQGKQGDVQEELALAAKSHAQVELLAWRLDRAEIKTPIDGVVLTGDLKQKLGSPVRTGDELFDIGDYHKLRAELTVPEDRVAEIAVGQKGELAASTYPGQHIPFVVQSVNPLAVVTDQHNVFKVRAVFKPQDLKSWMKPGMEGIAKVHVGKARLIWIWTHQLVNWVRMRLWM